MPSNMQWSFYVVKICIALLAAVKHALLFCFHDVNHALHCASRLHMRRMCGEFNLLRRSRFECNCIAMAGGAKLSGLDTPDTLDKLDTKASAYHG